MAFIINRPTMHLKIHNQPKEVYFLVNSAQKQPVLKSNMQHSFPTGIHKSLCDTIKLK